MAVAAPDMTLPELAERIKADAATNLDYIAPSEKMTYTVTDGTPRIGFTAQREIAPDHFELHEVNAPLRSLVHSHITTTWDIPKRFYDRLLTDHPSIVEHVVNALFRRQPSDRMVRTQRGEVRALVSKGYRKLDYADLMAAVVPVLRDEIAPALGGLSIVGCQITDRRLYIKLVGPKFAGDVVVGDPVRPGLLIKNSEVGEGYVETRPFVEVLRCKNGLVLDEFVSRGRHARRYTGDDADEAREYYSDATLAADDTAFWMKVQDSVRASLKEDRFAEILATLRQSADTPLVRGAMTPKRRESVVEAVGQRFAFSEAQRDAVLDQLINEDNSLWGLSNAITFAAQAETEYDSRMSLEAIGGKVVKMTAHDLGIESLS